jgi:prevent-host-death family protein
MSYTVHQAKTNLSRLIKEAESGKEVIITRGKEPVAKLIPIAAQSGVATPDPSKEVPTKAPSAPPAFAPLTDEELAELGLE